MAYINQVAKEVVAKAIDMEYVKECGRKTVGEVYHAEYGNYRGLTPTSCKDYLQGLPSVCTVPFYNSEILAILEANGITRKTDKGQDSLIDQYWVEVGNALYLYIKRETK